MTLWRNAFRLAWRELRHGTRGFGVFLLCLFLGVFSVAAINSFSEASRAGLQADARSLLGGDLELRLTQRPVTEDQKSALKGEGRVSTVVGLRSMARSDQASLLVEVKAVDNSYPLVGEIGTPDMEITKAISLQNGRYGALVESSLLQRLKLEVGQTLRLGEIELEVRGRITREPDAARFAALPWGHG